MGESKAGIWVHVGIVAAITAVIVLLSVVGVTHERREVEERRFVSAVAEGDVDEIRALLARYADHALASEAQAALADDGRDVIDLLDEGKIQVGATGVDIQNISLAITNLTSHGINVIVPAGTYFTPLNASTQTLVSTAEVSVRVSSWGSAPASVAAACASLPRNIPTRADIFVIGRAPAHADFARLMPVLAQARVTYPVQQAAVWIISDDANYTELGHLSAAGVVRIINEPYVANAMRIVDGAGIDITQRRIWSDREYIVSQLPESDIESWLAAR
jgi:hypothetical protein